MNENSTSLNLENLNLIIQNSIKQIKCIESDINYFKLLNKKNS